MTQGREMHIVTRVAATASWRVVSVFMHRFLGRDPLGCRQQLEAVPYDYAAFSGTYWTVTICEKRFYTFHSEPLE